MSKNGKRSLPQVFTVGPSFESAYEASVALVWNLMKGEGWLLEGSSHLVSVLNNHGDCFRHLRIGLDWDPETKWLFTHSMAKKMGGPILTTYIHWDDPPSR